jgi:ADP-ribose pyrophosphatase
MKVTAQTDRGVLTSELAGLSHAFLSGRERMYKKCSPDLILAVARGYPPRVAVPVDQRAWEVPFPSYCPTAYESQAVQANDRARCSAGGADPARYAADDFHRKYAQGEMRSWLGDYQLDATTGRPLNPYGRTGIAGRGALFSWGPNKAADAIVTRIGADSGQLEILLIQRPSGEWALPGGFLNQGENSRSAAQRELEEETTLCLDLAHAKRIFSGLIIDPRMTDNAWIESEAYQLHLGRADSTVHGADDAQAAQWFVVNEALVESLYASHSELVRQALDKGSF